MMIRNTLSFGKAIFKSSRWFLRSNFSLVLLTLFTPATNILDNLFLQICFGANLWSNSYHTSKSGRNLWWDYLWQNKIYRIRVKSVVRLFYRRIFVAVNLFTYLRSKSGIIFSVSFASVKFSLVGQGKSQISVSSLKASLFEESSLAQNLKLFLSSSSSSAAHFYISTVKKFFSKNKKCSQKIQVEIYSLTSGKVGR